MMKKLVLFLVVLLMAAPLAVFAGGAGEEAAGADDGQYKVALIIENTIDDKGWCQSMHDGILAARQCMTVFLLHRNSFPARSTMSIPRR